MLTGRNLSEQELIGRLQAGDEAAFNALYQLHSKMLFNNIFHLVKDREVAKELLQDLYMKIWENRAGLDKEKSFKSYLFTIATHRVYDYFRRVSLDKRMKVRLIALASESYLRTDDTLELKEVNDGIMTAINSLPPQSRAVYKLGKLEGKSHEEISAVLGISVSTVNNHMVKANKAVKAFLLKNTKMALLLISYALVNHK